MSKMLWVARGANDGDTWVYSVKPHMGALGYWQVEGDEDASRLDDNDATDLQPGECRMFVEFAPRVAEEGTWGQDEKPAQLVWDKRVWTLSFGQDAGDIILPMPPDPTPHLRPALAALDKVEV